MANIKLKDHYWETEGIYDAAQSKTQKAINSEVISKLGGIEAGAQVNRTYTATTGKPAANQTPSFGGTATISQVTQDATGQISVTDRTIKIPNSTASTSAAGLMSAADKTALDAAVSNIGTMSEMGTTATTLAGGIGELNGALTSIGDIQNVGRLGNTSFTEQIDALNVPSGGAGAVYFGTIEKTAVGVPVETSGNFLAYVYTSGYKKIYYYPISSNDDAYVIVRTANGWGSWIKLPTRSDVSTLQTNVSTLQTNVSTLQTGISGAATISGSTASAISHTVNVPNTSSHFLIIYGIANETQLIAWASTTSNGTLTFHSLQQGASITVTPESYNTFSYSYNDNKLRTPKMIDFCLNGDPCTMTAN